MHALRAENAALRAENAALRTDAGAPPSASSRPAPDDSAVSLHPEMRTWESAGAGDALSGADLERYARHISLPAFGAAKQASLARARALIVGVGGLGSPRPCTSPPRASGPILADADVVERSNLHRQIAHADARARRQQGVVRGDRDRRAQSSHERKDTSGGCHPKKRAGARQRRGRRVGLHGQSESAVPALGRVRVAEKAARLRRRGRHGGPAHGVRQ